jgi:CheY-like chemotaxis protein
MNTMNEKYTIMMIDDDYVNNYLNAMLLEESGLVKDLFIYTQPDRALAFLQKACSSNPDPFADPFPHVIILDLKMPLMDGFEFLEKFNAIPGIDERDVKIFVVTSSDHSSDVKRASQFSIAGYITKPVTEEKIVYLLQQADRYQTGW